MGGVSAALPANPWAGMTNPAGLQGLERPWASGGVQAAELSGTAYPSFGGTEARFSDSYARPASLALAYPLGRATLQASWSSLAYVESHVSFEGPRGEQERKRAERSLSELGLAASFQVTPRLALGLSVGGTQLTSHYEDRIERVLDFRSTGPTPYIYRADRSGSDWAPSFAVGLLAGSPESRMTFGLVWRKGQTFEIPYSTSDSFPSLGLSFPEGGIGGNPSASAYFGGMSVRLFGRLRLGLDLGYGGESPDAITSICGYWDEVPEICFGDYDGPRSPPVGGHFSRLGAEITLPWRTPVFLRAGVEGGELSTRGTFGAGVLIATRFQIDAAAAFGEGYRRALLTLSLRL